MDPLPRAVCLSLLLPALLWAQSKDDWSGFDALSAQLKQKSAVAGEASVAGTPASTPGPSKGCDKNKWYGAEPDPSAPLPDSGGAARLAQRSFPSVFMAWTGAENAPDSNHDVQIYGDWSLGVRPINNCIGFGVGFDPGRIAKGLSARANIVGANANAVLLFAVHYYDAAEGYLDDDSDWWLRKSKGGPRESDGKNANPQKPSDYFLLDFHNPEFRQHVALQCRAAILSGIYDGCFFDWWSGDDADRLDLLERTRKAIGSGPLLFANVNNRLAAQSAQYLNGVYMEGFNSRFWPIDAQNDKQRKAAQALPQGWQTAMDNLQWYAQNLREPAVPLIEGWFSKAWDDPADLQMMRALTALTLTQSDGCALFAEPDNVSQHDHRHLWYPFWNKALGRPLGTGKPSPDGTWRREFEHGTAVFSPGPAPDGAINLK